MIYEFKKMNKPHGHDENSSFTFDWLVHFFVNLKKISLFLGILKFCCIPYGTSHSTLHVYI